MRRENSDHAWAGLSLRPINVGHTSLLFAKLDTLSRSVKQWLSLISVSSALVLGDMYTGQLRHPGTSALQIST